MPRLSLCQAFPSATTGPLVVALRVSVGPLGVDGAAFAAQTLRGCGARFQINSLLRCGIGVLHRRARVRSHPMPKSEQRPPL